MANNVFRLLEGQAERPHWAAQIENFKNEIMANTLENTGFEPRIQPYASYGSTQKIRVLGRVLFAGANAAPNHHDQPVYDMRSLAKRGFRNFVSQISPFTEVRIEIPAAANPLETTDSAKNKSAKKKPAESKSVANKTVTVTVYSDRSGLIDEVIEAQLSPGWHQVKLSTAGGKTVTSDVLIVDETKQKVGVISDIDDTVIVTLLPRPLLAAWNAFVTSQASRQVVPGMPVLYQKLLREYSSAMPFIYLSTGAWNVSPVLQRFLFKNGYPAGPMLLTDWGPTNTGFFRSGQAHKQRSLELLHEIFPQLKWLLIGDNGQHDPQIYSDFAAKYPQAVKAIVIRELTEDQQDLARGGVHPFKAVGAAVRSAIALIPKVWKLSSSAKTNPVLEVSSAAKIGTAKRVDTAVSTVNQAMQKDATPTTAKAEKNTQPAMAPGVSYVSGKDGFELIKELRKHQILSENN